VIVKDNGIGMPPDDQVLWSMGLEITNALAQQLGGQMEIERNDGTSVSIAFTAGTDARRSTAEEKQTV
jgi:two-component sensor histidine kinase